MEKKEKFLNYVKKMQDYSEAIGLMYWDLRTGAPKKGVDQRSQVIGTLSSELFGMQTSVELGEMLVGLAKNLE